MRLGRRLVLAVLPVVMASALAEDIHLVSPGSTTQVPLSPSALRSRVQEAAARYQQYAPIPRFGVFDVAYPRDAAEYEATGGFGIVLVAIDSQQSAELPLKRLYLRTGGETVDLTMLSSASSFVEPGSLEHRVFGRFRWEALYVFPASRQQVGSELVADFQANRSGFLLATFQASGASRTEGAQGMALAERSPDKQALLALAEREFPGFVDAHASGGASASTTRK